MQYATTAEMTHLLVNVKVELQISYFVIMFGPRLSVTHQEQPVIAEKIGAMNRKNKDSNRSCCARKDRQFSHG